MPIEFACESCARLLRVPDGSGGMVCECPACKSQLVVPDPDAVGIVESAQDKPTNAQQVRIPCPKCQQALICSRKLLGTKGQCRHCQYIFVISEASDARVSAATAEWLFNCPKCQQLFEGKEEMRGRKGKCHSCGEVFAIELRQTLQDVSAISPASKVTSPTPAGGTAPRQPKPKAKSQPTPKSVAQPTPQPAPATSLQPIQLTCTTCRGVMEVPGDAAGQTTACPFCQKLLQIPRPDVQSPSPAPSNRPGTQSSSLGDGAGWDGGSLDLGGRVGDGGNPGSKGKGSAPSHLKTKSLAAAAASNPASFRPRTPGSLPSGRGKQSYFTPGLITSVLAGIELVVLAFATIWPFAFPSEALQGQPAGASQLFYFLTIGGGVVGGALLVVKLIGGIALARRRNLMLARAGAILACIPCYCLLLGIPVGIWGIILTFSGDARRDFR